MDSIACALRGMFCAIATRSFYRREEQKAGNPRAARIVTTSSGAGLFGSVSQANYSAAKAGIATFTVIAAAELARYGVLANTIAPSARSRMTEDAFAEMMAKPDEGFDAMDPANVSPFVVAAGGRRQERHRASFRDGGWRDASDNGGPSNAPSTGRPA